MSKEFKLADLSHRAIELFKEARHVFDTSHNEKVKELSSKVPQTFENDSPLSLVFAGQYSAGKSTILSLLTGEELKTGQGVTTAQTKEIVWNGMKVIDTPGIHTQKHPDHDKITYDAISKADLIVFVLTNEGFSPHLASHFRKLINEVGKGHEMMLVVNKMSDEPLGNSPESRAIRGADIQKVLNPNYSLKDMYTSFISAEMYRDAATELDPEIKAIDLEESNWEEFIDNLNKFAKDKNLIGKYTTNLYTLEQILQDALLMYSTDNPEADASLELLNRNRRALVQCRGNILERTHQEIGHSCEEVREIGDSIALSLNSKCKEEEFNETLRKAYDKTDEISDRTLRTIEEIIGDETKKLSKAINEVMSSQLAIDLRTALQKEIKKRNLNPELYYKSQKVTQYAKDFGGWLDKFAKSPTAKGGWDQIFKLGNYSGSGAHKAVLEIGHFFGHKFKPWEAVKMAGKIGKAGKFLGVAGAFLGVVLQIVNDVQESNLEENLRETRNDIREGFRSAAQVIEMEFDKQTNTWVAKEIDGAIQEVDEAIADLENIRKMKQL